MTLLASLAAVLGYIVAPLASVFFVAWDGAAILFAGRGACWSGHRVAALQGFGEVFFRSGCVFNNLQETLNHWKY